jgi:phage terminase large subunit
LATIEVPKAFRDLYKPSRYKVYWGGRGGAKSWAFAQALLVQGVQQPLRILCTREYQGSIQDSVHALLRDQISRLGLESFYTTTATSIRGLNGTEFSFLGIKHDPQKIKSTEGVDRCWVEEADKVSEESWRLLIPTIRKAGSEIWVSFNPSLKTDPTYQRFIVYPPKGALVKKVSWRDNPWFSKELIDEMEHDKERDYDEYLHIWEGELKSFSDGSIYEQQIKQAKKDGRITTVPIESVETHTFWDLGRNDHTAIWFMQHIGLQYRMVDYYENRLVNIEHYAQVLKDKGYTYGSHYMPHDVEIQVLGMHSTRREMFEDLGVSPIEVVPRILNINEGIEQVRGIFPKCWFDEQRCERGLEALAQYQYVYDDQHATHRLTPLHNWASNGADAFRMMAQGYNPVDDDWYVDGPVYPDLGI